MTWLKNYLVFLRRSAGVALVGDWRYYLWVGLLTGATLVGLHAYAKQFVHGLGVTGMTDHVSWGVYIANFTFLVGVADAAVMLVIPVFIYKHKDMHDLVIFGQILAVSSILMCLAFVMVDLGNPLMSWHLIPVIGKFNFPGSMLSWDVIVLNGYLLLNVYIVGYLMYCRYRNMNPSKWFYIPFVFISIIWAVSIHTVTAFLYVGLGGRPFWNAAIIGPRFMASAFAAGPAIIILALRVIRRVTDYHISNRALLTLRGIAQVSMIISVFLLLNELFKEFYTADLHMSASQYLYFGLDGKNALVPWIWTAIAFNLISLVLLILPVSRSLRWLDLACVLAIVGVWIEKGMGLVIPGFVPTPLGEVVEYAPTLDETLISFGVWAFGFLSYTIFLRMAVPVLQGRMTKANEATS